MAREEVTSRLSESSVTQKRREFLQTRNLYTEFKQYPPEPDQVEKIVNAIGSVVDNVLPFKSINLKDSAFSRLITLPNTPLTDIGLVMLGKNFALNFSSNLAQQTFPSFKPLNAFKKGERIFEKNINNKITYGSTGRTSLGDVNQFLERFLSFTKAENPLPVNVTNDELISRTGRGQLSFLYGDGKTTGGLNRNIYKDTTNYELLVRDKNITINDRKDLGSNRTWFNFSTKKFYTYLPFNVSTTSEDNANDLMISALNLEVNDSGSGNDPYAPNKEW
jgi:hypothetical protein